ncbi:MAG: cyclopropane-fatty-acyl-phospholipid synthase family protein [Gammaproteobacteria bacterium]
MSSHSEESIDLTASSSKRSRRGSPGRATWLDQWFARKLLSYIGDPPIALVLWDNTAITPENSRTEYHVLFHDRAALWLMLPNATLKFGDCYSNGRVEVQEDLVDFLETVYRHMITVRRPYLVQLFLTLKQRFTHNTIPMARRNIHHHYDIGNAFYTKWLDREMQYTCAYFPDPAITLEQAQIAKMHHVCRKLRLQPGQTVVEAGCGWGGLARFMAREYGVNVKAYNISKEQVAWARERAREEGLQDKVEYVEDDFRTITGEFDVFVSVGMLEHVGINNYRELGKVIDGCLKENGMGLIHSIGRNHPAYLDPWIESRIFPGARPPSIGQMAAIFEPYNFSILDIENLRQHYAKTLEHWLSRFEDHVDEIRQDFDDNFVRAWRLYLAGSKSSFTVGTLQLFQVVFTRPRNNALPWSRSHLYTDHS